GRAVADGVAPDEVMAVVVVMRAGEGPVAEAEGVVEAVRLSGRAAVAKTTSPKTSCCWAGAT
ncbi:hypothetical protein Q0M25_13475, partial [Staphylococcus aureus]|nr:hypothetical protein [Staphylococcus aureus]